MAEEKEIKEDAKEVKKSEDQKPSFSHMHNKWMLFGVAALITFVIVVFGTLAFHKVTEVGQFGRKSELRGGYGMMHGGVMGRGRGQFGGRGMMSGHSASAGKVTAVNGQTLTVDFSGDSKTVQISDTTRFPLNSATAVKVGDQVVVVGEQDSKGVIQATRIIVNPATSVNQ